MPELGPPDRSGWRIRLELASDPGRTQTFDLIGEVILGRSRSDGNHISLMDFGAGNLGVSRDHAILRPTDLSRLYIIDLDTTNGTYCNGQRIGSQIAYPLNDGDTVSLGRLHVVLRIIQRPAGSISSLVRKADLADALATVARSIMSQLELEEVLKRVVESATALVAVGEISIWLVDPTTGDLTLSNHLGYDDEIDRQPPSTDVVRTGMPSRVRGNYGDSGLPLFVPIQLAGQTIGVLSATNREYGRSFSKRDETLLGAIVDFAAVAIQNSRTYQITHAGLARRNQELTSLVEVLDAANSTLDLAAVHDVLMERIHLHWAIEAAALWLVDDTDGTLHAYGNPPDRRTPTNFKIGQGIIGKVAEHQVSFRDCDVVNVRGYDRAIDTATGVAARSMIAVPLLLRQQTIGALALFNEQEDRFTDQDVERLEVLARPLTLICAVTQLRHDTGDE